MDTNQNTANNYQINTFVKGMNSDTSYDMIGADQYLFGLNIRITNNTLLWGDLDSNNTEMVVAPVPAGIPIGLKSISNVDKILAVGSIENIGAIVIKTADGKWQIYKAVYSDDSVAFSNNPIYVSTSTAEADKFSMVLIKEVEGVIKAYIADGEGPVICIFIENSGIENLEEYYKTNNQYIDTNLLRAGMYFPDTKPTIQKTAGNLKTQLVQYTYRFYKQYGYISKLSPFTNKIHVIGDNRHSEQGNAEDTITNIGFSLTIERPTVDIFDRLLVFRVSYIKYNQTPEIYLIYDKKIPVEGDITVLDEGSVALQLYSLDEFASLQTQVLAPDVIESNQGYLFCANVTDGTIIDSSELSAINLSAKVTQNTINVKSESDDYIPVGGEQAIVYDDNKDVNDNINQIYTYLTDCKINPRSTDGSDSKLSYNDMFVSSMLRSLRRDELYNYGVVYYDKYGRHSQVLPLEQVSTKNLSSYTQTSTDVPTLGLKITIEGFEGKNLAGFEIVRQQKNYNNLENLLLVALSRPIRQGKNGQDSYRTPYYPSMFLSSLFIYHRFNDGVEYTELDLHKLYFDHNATNIENFTLFQAFSPDINFYRNDVLSRITGNSINLHPLIYQYDADSFQDSEALKKLFKSVYKNTNTGVMRPGRDSGYTTSLGGNIHSLLDDDGYYQVDLILNIAFANSISNKSDRATSFIFGNNSYEDIQAAESFIIKNVADVKNPNWENGFTGLQFSDTTASVVKDAIKQYLSYNTIIGTHEYNNWVSSSLYNLAVSESAYESQLGNPGAYVFHGATDYNDNRFSNGLIGPGPVCILLELDSIYEEQGNRGILDKHFKVGVNNNHFGTLVCSIRHDVSEQQSYSNLDPYLGFGNYFKFPDSGNSITVRVFDGDVYNDYAEFVNMFKTYDFNDHLYSLQSGQIVYYIPMESEANVRFDYGCNYRNTQSTNLLLEPGKIEGIISQDRPLHQYNRIYSDNNNSINVFYEKPDNEEVVDYPNRIVYSQLKTNGELIDNWLNFKPADFIDCDSRNGDITNLLASDNNIYFWQTGAFGKLSVNERSLVTDNNGETIQLGQGGVLLRVDYLSTKYGMRERDFCAVNTEDAIYWIDILNKAILICRQNQVANYGELLNVLNIINKYIDDEVHPRIHYDLQTNELLCQCLKDTFDEKLLVFNTKYSIAESLYTRQYEDIISFNNVLVALSLSTDHIYCTQHNYLDNNATIEYLRPTILEFVINSSASQTKVFDNQKVVTLSRNSNEAEEYEVGNNGERLKSKTYWDKNQRYLTLYILNKNFKFSTDIRNTNNKPNAVTDREGNIIYDIPRTGSNDWGDRLRGKWMRETITDSDPKLDYCISHIITKFRQSYI